jgi:hypothetical protein
VSNGSGTAMGDVTSVTVACTAPASFTVGGTVTGLVAGTNGVILQDRVNGSAADSVTLNANGSFAFATSVMASDTFAVTVETQPDLPIQNCTVMNGTGTVSGDVGSVTVSCAAPPVYSIGGTIVDLTGSSSGLVLQDNGGDTFTPTANGAFTFATNVEGGEPYSVAISQQPTSPAQNCSVANGTGTAIGNVSNVVIDCGHEEWGWMSGSSAPGAFGVYGTLGVAASTNAPGARQNPVTWTDLFGNFWMFGGYGFDSVGTLEPMNDLWKYSHGQWTGMGGSSVAGASGVYGTLGVASASNVPGARFQAAFWSNGNGEVWMFGGNGFDSTGVELPLNDLWKFSNGEWTWMGGPNVGGALSTYGTKGVAATTNMPGSRSYSTTWTDASGNFWLFGGLGYDINNAQGFMNDLWEYTGGEWIWVSGSQTVNQFGVYGTRGSAAAGNVPGARYAASGWTDQDGNLWMFAGNGYSVSEVGVTLDDLWKFSNGEWTWMSGANTAGYTGLYGTQGEPAAGNFPGGRQGAIVRADSLGNVWLFGGYGSVPGGFAYMNDLWEYSNGQWAWISGSQAGNQAGTFGTEGAFAPGNVPGGLQNSVMWIDGGENVWVFGGFGLSASGAAQNANGMWEWKF